jgi:hypothetical protein
MALITSFFTYTPPLPMPWLRTPSTSPTSSFASSVTSPTLLSALTYSKERESIALPEEPTLEPSTSSPTSKQSPSTCKEIACRHTAFPKSTPAQQRIAETAAIEGTSERIVLGTPVTRTPVGKNPVENFTVNPAKQPTTQTTDKPTPERKTNP